MSKYIRCGWYLLLSLTAFPVNVNATQRFLVIITEFLSRETSVTCCLCVRSITSFNFYFKQPHERRDLAHPVWNGVNSRNTFQVKVLTRFKVRWVSLKNIIFSWCITDVFWSRNIGYAPNASDVKKSRIWSHLERLSKSRKTLWRWCRCLEICRNAYDT